MARLAARPSIHPAAAAVPQVSHSPYRGVLHCAQSTFQEEGLRAFYKSYWTTVRPGRSLLGVKRGVVGRV